MGKCRCGCNEDISIRSGDYLQKYKRYHGIKGENSNLWKGGFLPNRKGYEYIFKPNHPKSNSDGYYPYHRWVYEQHYNCCLLPWYDIDHINKNTHDNRVENLRPLTHQEHGSISARKDMSGRVCLECGMTEKDRTDSDIRKWYNYKNGHLCSICYKRLKRRKII